MKCLQKSDIAKWVDGEIAQSSVLLEHMNSCLACQSELLSAQRVRALLKTSSPAIDPSSSFDSGFWGKVNASIEEPWYRRVLAEMEELIPKMTLAPALAALMVALLVGGASGFGSSLSQGSVPNSGDYKGLPAGSVAAAYLQSMERTA